MSGMTNEERRVLLLPSALHGDFEEHHEYFDEPINVDGRIWTMGGLLREVRTRDDWMDRTTYVIELFFFNSIFDVALNQRFDWTTTHSAEARTRLLLPPESSDSSSRSPSNVIDVFSS